MSDNQVEKFDKRLYQKSQFFRKSGKNSDSDPELRSSYTLESSRIAIQPRSLGEWSGSFKAYSGKPDFDDKVAKSVVNEFLKSKYDAQSIKEAVILRGSEANSKVILKNLRRDFLYWLKDEKSELVSPSVKDKESERTYAVEEGESAEPTDELKKPKALWMNGETVLKAKNAIFDPNNPEKNLIQAYKKDFLEETYGEKTIGGALDKISEKQGSGVEWNIVKDLMASDFLYWLKDKKKKGAIESIEKHSGAVMKPETKRAIEEDQGFSNLSLNENALNKFVGDSETDQRIFRYFADRWQHSDVGWFGFGVAGSKDNPNVMAISNVILVTKAGERITLDAERFRSVFAYVYPSKKPGTDIVTGLAFARGRGEIVGKIYPGKKVEEVKEVMSKVKLDGKTLPEDTIFFIG